ncbi:hypothetical protein [Rubrivivax gelatinosus]|uniref:Lipoprotein n=1 Tax=Rubrivivax gelatinosus TaxID=28068 RepID=A0A4R2LZ41_RUBGE|nr:hypothetical protein [Rubrivivax gelatinosus]TCO97694.1 hypothetical protein EV684_1205 [Rubrivivax gelatinosus]
MRIGQTPRSKAERPLRALAGAAFVGVLAACGGGVVDDNDGEADHLVCATGCKPSSSLASNEIRAYFAVLDDGSSVQAQAGFSAGSDPRFNVEIDGNDRLQLVTPKGTQDFHIPAGNVATVIGDALLTLITGAKPYVSKIDPPSAATPLRFEFVRGTTTLVSSVELPAPFKILSPASRSTLPLAQRTLPIRLSATEVGWSHYTSIDCTDVNGNKGSGTPGLDVVAGSFTRDSSGVSYSLDLGAAIDGLSYSTVHPRGAVARCDVDLQVVVLRQGLTDPAFASAQVYGKQARSISIALR